MKQIKQLLSISFFLLACSSAIFAKSPLAVGSPAPALNPDAWIKGGPINHFQPGKIYVIDFWATWCVPCNESMPHLSDIATKYAGKVDVIGVDCRERLQGAALVNNVSAFVKRKGQIMAYHVCLDKSGNAFKNWMLASNNFGIPCAFVVDGKGKVANIVIGFQENDARIDSTINHILLGAGKPTLTLVSLQKSALAQKAWADTLAPIKECISRKDFRQALKYINHASAAHPEYAQRLEFMRYTVLANTDPDRVYKLAKRERPTGSVEDKAMLFADAFNQDGLQHRFYKYGIGVYDKMIAMHPKMQFLHAIVAQFYFKDGDKRDAVREQKTFIASLAGKKSGPGEREAAENDLQKYERI